MEEEVVKELLQFNLARDITKELDRILNQEVYRNQMLEKYGELKERCGGPGASGRAASLMVNYLGESKGSTSQTGI